MNEHQVVLAIVTVAGLGVGAQWLAWRLKMPAIVLLAAVGLIMGPGLDLIHPSRDFGQFLRPVVSLCVAIILFEGGLSLQLRELKDAAIGVRRDKPADGIEVLIMNEDKDVEFHSSQYTQEPEAGDTIVYFARAENPQSSKTVDAPVG